MSGSYEDIGALSVKLNLQTNDFNRKISSINKEIRFLERDFKSAGKGLKNFENSFQGVNSKMQTLNKQISLSNTKLKEQKKRYSEFSTELATQRLKLESLKNTYGETSKEYKTQAKLVQQLAEKTRSVGSAIKTTEGALREYSSKLKEAQQKMREMGNTTKTFGQKLKVLQEESKMTATSFDAMINSLSPNSFARARTEMQQLSSSITNAKQQVSLYTAEIQKMESKQTKMKNQISSLGSEIKSTATKLREAKTRYGENSTEVQKLNEKLMTLKTKLAQARAEHTQNASAIRTHRTELNTLNGNISSMTSQLNNIPFDTVSQRFIGMGQSMTNTGLMMSATIGLPLTMLAKESVSTSMTFEEAMSKVKAVSSASGSQMEILTQQARDLGRETQFSATESADAMGFLAMAGFDVGQIYTSMPSQLALAKAGMMDLGRTADITSNIMSGFGLQADDMNHISDVIAHASSNANTNIEQMGEAMTYLAPISNTLGLSLEDVSSAVMAVSNNGIQGARAGAAFSTSLARLTKPTKQMKNKMEELGITFEGAGGKLKPIYEIVGDLNKSMKGYDKTQKAAAINTLFGAEATRHWASMLSVGEETLKKQTKELENSDGAAEKMADTMADNLAGSVKEMQSKIEDFMITVGNSMAPTIQDITEKIGELADWFQSLSPQMQSTIVKMGALAVALPLVITATGLLSTGIGNTVKMFQMLDGGTGRLIGSLSRTGSSMRNTQGIFTRALPLMTNPWTLLGGAIVGTGLTLYAFKKEADKRFKEVNESARKHVSGVGDYFEKDLPQFVEGFKANLNDKDIFKDFSEKSRKSLNLSMDNLQKALKTGSGNVTQIYGNMVSEIGKNMDSIPKDMRESVVTGFVEFGENLAREGKITTKQFEEWVNELNKKAKIKIEIDTKSIEDSNKVRRYFDDWTLAMKENVGSGIQKIAGDIGQTLGNMEQIFTKTKDVGITEFTNLAQGMAEQIASMGGSFENKKAIFNSFVDTMKNTLNPEQLAVLLTTFNDQLKLGTEGMKSINQQFYDSWTTSDSEGRAKLIQGFNHYVEQIGGSSVLLGENFNAIVSQDGAFWANYYASLSGKSGEVTKKAREFVTQYSQTLLETGDPSLIAGGIIQLNNFVAELVSTGAISKNEAGKIVGDINGQLSNITPEVETKIKADISKFDTEQMAVLVALGIIDKEEAVATIKAKNDEAIKKMKETDSKAGKTKASIEKKEAKIKADNKNAISKLDEVIQKLGGLKGKTVPVTVRYHEVGKPSTVSGGSSGNRSFETDYSSYSQAVIPYSLASSFETREFNPFGLMESYANDVFSMDNSFQAMRSSLDNLDYSSASLYQPKPREKQTIVVTNETDSTMLNLMNSVVESIQLLAQRQNTFEAKLYMDSSQVKTKIDKIEKRKTRLAGGK